MINHPGHSAEFSDHNTPLSESERKAYWLQERKNIITATDAAKILGFSKFGSPISVYMDKLGLGQPVEVTEAMEAGNRFERPILEWYADREGVEKLVFGEPYTLTISPTHPLIGASLDTQALKTSVLYPVDAKNIGYDRGGYGEPGTDQIPLYYASQLIIQMHVTEAPHADLAVVFGGQKLLTYRLHRNLTLEHEIVGRCMDFWHNHIVTETPPEVDGSVQYTEYLQQLVKQTSERTIAATSEMHGVAMRLQNVKEDLERLEAEETLYKNQMRSWIGESKTLVGSCWKANWSIPKDSEKVEWKRVTEELVFEMKDKYPELAGDIDRYLAEWIKYCTVTTPGSRRLTFNWKG